MKSTSRSSEPKTKSVLQAISLREQLIAWGTILSGVAAIAGIFFINKQLNLANVTAVESHMVAAYDLLRKEDDRFQSIEMKNRRIQLSKLMLEEWDNPKKNFQSYEPYAEPLLDHFESLGFMLRNRLVDSASLLDLESYEALYYWDALKDYMAWQKHRDGEEDYYSDFDLFRNELLKAKKKSSFSTPGVARPILKEFLKSESKLI